jgi:nicotinamide mononucleotide transporter
MQNLLNSNTVFFTIFGYPMSYVEFVGTLFTGYSVFLAAKNKLINWPIGIVGTILYGFLFYQIQLYSDFFEQIYFFITGFWGWYVWSHPRNTRLGSTKEIAVTETSKHFIWLAVLAVLVFSAALGYLMSNIHLLLPQYFPIAASFPYLDAFTTVLSFVATVFLAKRKIENWYMWIIVDLIGVMLYYQKGVVFISLLYFAFLLNAFIGLRIWKKAQRSYKYAL